MKYKLYFVIASYFRFFARLVIKRWKPVIIAVTGSAGKSTSLYLIANLLRKKYLVRKSTKANSAFGVPLDILDFHFTNYTRMEWIKAFIGAPFLALKRLLLPYPDQFYIVELDVDRPGEMEFFTKLLSFETVFWVSSFATHTANFVPLVEQELFKSLESAVAAEYARIITAFVSGGLFVANGDSPYIKEALKQKKFKNVTYVYDGKKPNGLLDWKIYRKRTEFSLAVNGEEKALILPYILPRNLGYTLVALYIIALRYNIEESHIAALMNEFTLLPGRCSIFDGINDTTVIDSSYNSSYFAATGLLEVLSLYPGKRKIAVLGDMRELEGTQAREHTRLAEAIATHKVDQVVLVGPMTKEYILPYLLLHGYSTQTAHHFDNTYQAGLFIKERLMKPGDAILLKASQNTLFFEIIVEMLLADKSNIEALCRREAVWQTKRDAIKREFYEKLRV